MNAHHTANGSILGLVAAVPDYVITNDRCPDPAAAHEAAKLTGVQERRWVRAVQTAADLCSAAAARLLDALHWQLADVDLLVYVTQTPDQAVPADVYSIAAGLGIKAPCVQVNWSCSGYVYGLWLTMRLLQPGQLGLLLVGDATSTICDPGDRATAPLFGDAGSATAVIGGGQEQHFFLGTDGTGAQKLCQSGPWLRMDGGAVFNFTLQRVPPLVQDVLGVMPTPDAFLFHQANEFMLNHLLRKCGVNRNRAPMNLQRFGNTSCASIPLLMAGAPDGSPPALFTYSAGRPWRLAMFGFGAGWAWAGAALECEALQVCELMEV